MSVDPYQPIACSQYDLYEIAIMRGQMVMLHWMDEQGIEYHARVKPRGLQTRQGEEFLLVVPEQTPENEPQFIRLDRIIALK